MFCCRSHYKFCSTSVAITTRSARGSESWWRSQLSATVTVSMPVKEVVFIFVFVYWCITITLRCIFQRPPQKAHISVGLFVYLSLLTVDRRYWAYLQYCGQAKPSKCPNYQLLIVCRRVMSLLCISEISEHATQYCAVCWDFSMKICDSLTPDFKRRLRESNSHPQWREKNERCRKLGQ